MKGSLSPRADACLDQDPRYKHLVGRKALVPLSRREIPIIADDYVDMEFGTGALKITPGEGTTVRLWRFSFFFFSVAVRARACPLGIMTYRIDRPVTLDRKQAPWYTGPCGGGLRRHGVNPRKHACDPLSLNAALASMSKMPLFRQRHVSSIQGLRAGAEGWAAERRR